MGVQINGSEGNVIATKGTYSGNVTIGGTLTYEDVTNIDSVGLVTARSGIEIGARPGVGASISVDGNAIFSGITTIGGASEFGGNMQMTATNPEFEMNAGGPRFRVPSANTLSIFTTGGLGSTSNERVRIDSSGGVHIATSSGNEKLNVHGAIRSSTSSANFNAGLEGALMDYDIAGGTIRFGHVNGASGSAKPVTFLSGGLEKVRIASTGELLVGTTTLSPHVRLNQRLGIAYAGDYTGASITNYGGTSAANKPVLDFNRSRGTSNASMTSVASGDGLAHIIFRGADGTNFVDSAAIRSDVDGSPGSNDMPGRLIFETTPDGSGTLVERMRIHNNGNVTKSFQYYLLVDRSSDLTGYDANGSFGTALIFDRIVEEQRDSSMSSSFNTSNGLFTAPFTGVYAFGASAYNGSGVNFTQSWFTLNGSRGPYTDWVKAASTLTANFQIIKLTAGNTVGFHPHAGGGNTNITIKVDANHTWMKVTLLH